jgi:hypothetical protein
MGASDDERERGWMGVSNSEYRPEQRRAWAGREQEVSAGDNECGQDGWVQATDGRERQQERARVDGCEQQRAQTRAMTSTGVGVNNRWQRARAGE